MADAEFKANVLKHKPYYETLRSQLGLVDFNPLTVDWTTPVPWGNDPDKCNMDDDSGANALLTLAPCSLALPTRLAHPPRLTPLRLPLLQAASCRSAPACAPPPASAKPCLHAPTRLTMWIDS